MTPEASFTLAAVLVCVVAPLGGAAVSVLRVPGLGPRLIAGVTLAASLAAALGVTAKGAGDAMPSGMVESP